MSDNKKQEFLDFIVKYYNSNYKSLNTFIDDNPYLLEMSKIDFDIKLAYDKLGGKFTYSEDKSKNSSEINNLLNLEKQKNIIINQINYFNQIKNIKSNIRQKLILLISILDKNDFIYNLLLEDIDEYIPHIKKTQRHLDNFKKSVNKY